MRAGRGKSANTRRRISFGRFEIEVNDARKESTAGMLIPSALIVLVSDWSVPEWWRKGSAEEEVIVSDINVILEILLSDDDEEENEIMGKGRVVVHFTSSRHPRGAVAQRLPLLIPIFSMGSTSELAGKVKM